MKILSQGNWISNFGLAVTLAILAPGAVWSADADNAADNSQTPSATSSTAPSVSTPVPQPTADLTQNSLESLMGLNVQVTSSSKKAESLMNATSAIYVITQEDIQRSGARHVADLLSMVPGVQVARQNAGQWAISARGFNGNYNNKMLVQVDGRSVYDPILGGVNWNQLDLMMEDIDRIEVIRGPGGTLWGSNAINGIVNIITKDTKVTQGLYVSGLGGSSIYGNGQLAPTGIDGLGAVRYGGKIADDLYYRIYGQVENQDPSENIGNIKPLNPINLGNDWHDGWYDIRAGFRTDLHADENTLTFEAEAEKGYFDYANIGTGTFPVFNPTLVSTAPLGVNDVNTNVDQNLHLLGQWTRDFKDDSQIQLLAYYDYNNQATVSNGQIVNIGQINAEFQHRFHLGSWNEITYGGSFRNYTDNFANPLNYYYTPYSENIYSGFLQDKLTLVQDYLYLTGGAKLENNPFTGDEWQPSGRLLFTPDTKNSVWAAVSRAVRIPDQSSEGEDVYLAGVPAGTVLPAPYGQPPYFYPYGPSYPFGATTQNIYSALVPNASLVSETLVSYEIGYRTNPTKDMSFDLSTFFNHYDNLLSFADANGSFYSPAGGIIEPLSSVGGQLSNFIVAQYKNTGEGNIYGAELSAKWQPVESLKINLSYTYQAYDQNMINASNPELGAPPPHNLINTRIYFDAFPGWQFNTSVSYTDATFLYAPTASQETITAPYWVWNLGASWKPTDNLQVALWGLDLEGAHTETLQSFGVQPTLVVPTVYAQATLRY